MGRKVAAQAQTGSRRESADQRTLALPFGYRDCELKLALFRPVRIVKHLAEELPADFRGQAMPSLRGRTIDVRPIQTEAWFRRDRGQGLP